METKNKKCWFAAYTTPRSEKKVYERLKSEGVVVYLPIHKTLRKWSDRKKWVEVPLLPSYIFVKITEREQHAVLNTAGLIRFVKFEGKPAPIPEEQINTIKLLLGQKLDIELLEENLKPGDKVEIILGSMLGFKGELIKHKGKNKALIKIDHISHGLLVTLPKGFITKSLDGDSVT
ncbi:MAG: UpxY family transcription antiterminator [Bacteroidales bacterium]